MFCAKVGYNKLSGVPPDDSPPIEWVIQMFLPLGTPGGPTVMVYYVTLHLGPNIIIPWVNITALAPSMEKHTTVLLAEKSFIPFFKTFFLLKCKLQRPLQFLSFLKFDYDSLIAKCLVATCL